MIIVTGANGFIGSCMVWQLNHLKLGPVIAVDSIDQQTRPLPLANRSIVNFLSKDQLWAFLEKNATTIKWIIHLGACSSTTETNVDFLQENNTDYTKKIFSWCTTNSVGLIYASSGAVYGDGKKGFSDLTPPNEFTPLNPYGESKAAFDRWVVEQKQTPANWYGLRFFNVYGPGEEHKQEMASVVYKASLQIKEKGSLGLFRSHRSEYKDGGQERDFIYVKDITRWIVELMDKTPDSGIYNMGFGKTRTWLELASAVFSNMNKAVKIDWMDMPENIRHQYQYTTCATTLKWQKQNLSAPQWSLEAGIQDYIDFLNRGGKYL